MLTKQRQQEHICSWISWLSDSYFSKTSAHRRHGQICKRTVLKEFTRQDLDLLSDVGELEGIAFWVLSESGIDS